MPWKCAITTSDGQSALNTQRLQVAGASGFTGDTGATGQCTGVTGGWTLPPVSRVSQVGGHSTIEAEPCHALEVCYHHN